MKHSKINLEISDINPKTERLTVGKLRRLLNKYPELPDDASILFERVTDIHFERDHPWATVKLDSVDTYYFKEFNKKVETGVFNDRERYPDITEDDIKPYSDEIIELSKDEYYLGFDCFVEQNALFFRAHY